WSTSRRRTRSPGWSPPTRPVTRSARSRSRASTPGRHRQDLDLPLLDLPWEPGDLAEGFELTDMVRGYRTLERAGGGPLAAAPDSTLSLIALVPLSHYLGWTIADLKRSFLSPTGAPLLRL